MHQKSKRKTYYIKNSVQDTFIFRFVVISLLGGIAALTVFNFLSYKKIDSILYSMHMPKVSPGGLLWNEMFYTNIFVIIFVLIVFALNARSLFIKIHGPLKKLTSDIHRLECGDLRFEISLREKDEFKEFAQDLTYMSAQLNKRFREIGQQTDAVIALAENSTTSATELQLAVESLDKTIGSFKR
jgi:methyl-accepting chemotaxis protein